LPEVCLQYKNPRFIAFSDSNLHTRLAIVTENELGLALPPRNLPKKFRPDPSTFYLVTVVTNKQTDRQTNAGKNIIPRFRGDDNVGMITVRRFIQSIWCNALTTLFPSPFLPSPPTHSLPTLPSHSVPSFLFPGAL